MFGLFFGKKEAHKIKEETKKSFDSVKKDLVSFSNWIKHLDSEKNLHKGDIQEIKKDLSTVKKEIEEIKNIIFSTEHLQKTILFKTPRTSQEKQTAVYPVQTAVQTAVQTPKLEQFSLTERAIIWVLLNTDMKLSYDDLSSILGKEKSTIRGQINTIKQKSEGFIQENIENNGKKRVYIPEVYKEKILKKSKVRVNSNKNIKKD